MAFFKKGKTPEPGSTSKKGKAGKSSSIESIGNVPLTAYDRAKAEWAERNGDATVNQARYFVIACIAMTVVVIMAIALAGLTPLKEVVPYEIVFEQSTGETTARPIKTKTFEPDSIQKRYFIARWVKQVMALDPFTTERDLSEAYSLVRGKAIPEFTEFLKLTQPVTRIKQDQSLTRTVEISSVQFLAENMAQVRVVTQERTASTDPLVKRFILTIHFVIEPPMTEPEMYKNPIGLRVTHFAISEELQ